MTKCQKRKGGMHSISPNKLYYPTPNPRRTCERWRCVDPRFFIRFPHFTRGPNQSKQASLRTGDWGSPGLPRVRNKGDGDKRTKVKTNTRTEQKSLLYIKRLAKARLTKPRQLSCCRGRLRDDSTKTIEICNPAVPNGLAVNERCDGSYN